MEITPFGGIMTRVTRSPRVIDVARRKARIRQRVMMRSPVEAIEGQVSEAQAKYSRSLQEMKAYYTNLMAQERAQGNYEGFKNAYNEYLAELDAYNQALERAQARMERTESSDYTEKLSEGLKMEQNAVKNEKSSASSWFNETRNYFTKEALNQQVSEAGRSAYSGGGTSYSRAVTGQDYTPASDETPVKVHKTFKDSGGKVVGYEVSGGAFGEGMSVAASKLTPTQQLSMPSAYFAPEPTFTPVPEPAPAPVVEAQSSWVADLSTKISNTISSLLGW